MRIMNEELVRKYEPVLRFAKGENFFPMNVEGYVHYCFLDKEGEDDSVQFPPHVKLENLPTGDDSRKYLLRFADYDVIDPREEARLQARVRDEREVKGIEDFQRIVLHLCTWAKGQGYDLRKIFRRLGVQHAPEVCARAIERYGGIDRHPLTYYYRVSPDEGEEQLERYRGYTAVQYWLFYAFNDFGTTYNMTNDHEADWESIHLFFEGDNFLKGREPSYVVYSAHVGKEVVKWRDTERDGKYHPIVYVGAGSHASYCMKEQAEAEGWLKGSVVAGGTYGERWAKPETLNKPWFLDFRGRWGAWGWKNPNPVKRTVQKKFGSPAGPKFERDGKERPKWKDPVGWAGL